MKNKFGHTGIAACVLALSVSACATVEPGVTIEKGVPIGLSAGQARIVQSGVRAGMKDPDSARFGAMAASQNSEGVITVCGYVNGKNSFGGYTGSKPYFGAFSDDKKSFQIGGIGGAESEMSSVIAVCRMAGVYI